MSRRVVLIIALVALALLGSAAVPWTLSSTGLPRALTSHLQTKYGLRLTVSGRSTIAFLPTPRVKFEDIKLASVDGKTQVDGGFLRGELRLIPLVLGRIELSEIMLSDTVITTSLEDLNSLSWAGPERNVARDPSRARRLVLTGTTIKWSDLPKGQIDRVNAVVSWRGGNEELTAAGFVSWRGEDIEIKQFSANPALLASAAPSPFALTLRSLSGKIDLTGEVQLGSDPRISGSSVIEGRSLRDFARWSGLSLPLSPLTGAVAISGDFLLDKRRLSWPSVTVSLGNDRLDGTLSVRLDSERPAIAGTLAADKINLSDFVAPFAQTKSLSGAWNEEPINLARMTGGDLDIRLSATKAKLGLLTFEDMAASIIAKPGQIEASLGRATFHDGTLKGRFSLFQVDGRPELKTQATFDHIDISGFLNVIGEPRWITGQGQGQIQVEAAGASVADLVKASHGRATVNIKRGELVGIGLSDVVKRIEKRPLAASLDWRGGKTAFDLVQISLAVDSGIGEIVDGRLTAPELRTVLKGNVSLADRTLRVKALVDPTTVTPEASPLIVFDIDGGWDSVTVTPDVKSLILRSGAAKPLFGPAQQVGGAPLPLATAQ